MIFADSSLSIGHTPMVRLSQIGRGLQAEIVAKIESRNPTGSVKCRVGAAMINAAEAQGILRRGSKTVSVIEPTSGNTGIGLAAVCAARGYRLVLTMPETMSIERRKILAAYGAEILLTPGSEGMAGSIAKAEALCLDDPTHYYMPQQFKNPANPECHYRTTGPEIWADCEGVIDCFVSSVGTGGTLTGCARYLKEAQAKRDGASKLHAVAVEPEGSAVLMALLKGETPKPGPHKIQGIGAGFKPDTLDLALVDEVATVSDDEAYACARRLHKEEGITAGISGGAALAAALRLAADPARAGQRIAIILPDAGERYLSTPGLFEV